MTEYNEPDHYKRVSYLGAEYLPQIGIPEYFMHLSCISIIQAMERRGWSFYMLNTIKYLYRAGKKSQNPTMDLYKAAHYLSLEIARRKREIEWLPKPIRDLAISNQRFDLALVESKINADRSRYLLLIEKHAQR